jgi:galactitol-specific phosphotransferase system IIB component
MRIAILCDMGFGTTIMLKLLIGDILKAEGIKAKVVPWDLGTFNGQQADIFGMPPAVATAPRLAASCAASSAGS